jgi:hypothetical protein
LFGWTSSKYFFFGGASSSERRASSSSRPVMTAPSRSSRDSRHDLPPPTALPFSSRDSRHAVSPPTAPSSWSWRSPRATMALRQTSLLATTASSCSSRDSRHAFCFLLQDIFGPFLRCGADRRKGFFGSCHTEGRDSTVCATPKKGTLRSVAHFFLFLVNGRLSPPRSPLLFVVTVTASSCRHPR